MCFKCWHHNSIRWWHSTNSRGAFYRLNTKRFCSWELQFQGTNKYGIKVTQAFWELCSKQIVYQRNDLVFKLVKVLFLENPYIIRVLPAVLLWITFHKYFFMTIPSRVGRIAAEMILLQCCGSTTVALFCSGAACYLLYEDLCRTPSRQVGGL